MPSFNMMLDGGNLMVASASWISARSNSMTGINAGDRVFELRNITDTATPRNRPMAIGGIALSFVTLTPITAGAVSFDLHKVSGFSALSAGGLSIAGQQRKTSGYDAIPAAEIAAKISDTAALAGGAFTAINANQPLHQFVGGGTTLFGFDAYITPPEQPVMPWVLEKDEGLIINNGVAIVGGTYRLFVRVDFVRQGN